ncbi:putative serine protease HhoB precursor [Phycisphaerae bacterium RAS1]|nr:putative serine protease HhoB precursor [Phycisphaerae bacterium RAS1]
MIALAVMLLLGAAAACADQPASPFAGAIDAAQARVVKLYGGAIGREQGYGSGVLVSADGKIVTALSSLLEGRSIRAVLADGRVLTARVTARDEHRQLAILQVESANLPYFELGSSEHLEPGDWVLSAANAFKVADGPEAVSVSVGVLAGRARLEARRRAQDFPYDGLVLLTDVIIATPGSAGGALVDAEGRLVGVIGKSVTSKLTNTFANFAIPVEEVAAFVAQPDAKPQDGSASPSQAEFSALRLGLRLFNVGSRRPPPFIERVRPGSPAQAAGLRAGDLVLSVNGRTTEACADVEELLRTALADKPLTIVVKRGESVLPFELKPAERP